MPSTSKKQHNAMAAAAAGNSTLGIPAKVGKEFMMADALRKGNSMYDYGNHTEGGIHITHWKSRPYGGSNQGGGSIGGGSAGS